MTKHTPGPWKVAGTMYVEQEGGRIIAHAVHMTRSNLEKETEEVRTCMANVRLIAMSPEMLGALEWIVQEIKWGHDMTASLAIAEQVIAKATRP